MNLFEKIKAIPLKDVIESAGINLSASGFARCPFHNDKAPSFHLKDNRFKCFGCGASGDVVDFVQSFYSLSFKEALKYLGIEQGQITADMKRQIAEAERKRQADVQHRQRESDLIFTLSKLIHHARNVMAAIKTGEDMDNGAEAINRLPWLEYCHDTLVYGDEDEKQLCLEALKDMPIRKRDRLFKPGFDFSAWLRGFVAQWNN